MEWGLSAAEGCMASCTVTPPTRGPNMLTQLSNVVEACRQGRAGTEVRQAQVLLLDSPLAVPPTGPGRLSVIKAARPILLWDPAGS